MLIKNKISLKPYNSFGIDVNAKYFAEVSSIEQFRRVNRFGAANKLSMLLLGGGSNILFTRDVDGLVVKNELLGKEIVKETDEFVFLKAQSGEDWPALVDYCVEHGWGGLENLSLIPGTVGAAPVQNIGAYGVEVKDVISEVEVFDVESEELFKLTNEECRFGYRNSIFKSSAKGRFFIVSALFKLSKLPSVEIEYAPLKQYLNDAGNHDVTIRDVSETVKQIRRSKLPDPLEIGNAGSFFKNPVVHKSIIIKLKNRFPDVPVYDVGNDLFKLAAGWLIEQAGWKGKKKGRVGVHEKQALVLVNYGGASGKDVVELANEVRKAVMEKFDVELDYEVNII